MRPLRPVHNQGNCSFIKPVPHCQWFGTWLISLLNGFSDFGVTTQYSSFLNADVIISTDSKEEAVLTAGRTQIYSVEDGQWRDGTPFPLPISLNSPASLQYQDTFLVLGGDDDFCSDKIFKASQVLGYYLKTFLFDVSVAVWRQYQKRKLDWTANKTEEVKQKLCGNVGRQQPLPIVRGGYGNHSWYDLCQIFEHGQFQTEGERGAPKIKRRASVQQCKIRFEVVSC